MARLHWAKRKIEKITNINFGLNGARLNQDIKKMKKAQRNLLEGIQLGEVKGSKDTLLIGQTYHWLNHEMAKRRNPAEPKLRGDSEGESKDQEIGG